MFLCSNHVKRNGLSPISTSIYLKKEWNKNTKILHVRFSCWQDKKWTADTILWCSAADQGVKIHQIKDVHGKEHDRKYIFRKLTSCMVRKTTHKFILKIIELSKVFFLSFFWESVGKHVSQTSKYEKVAPFFYRITFLPTRTFEEQRRHAAWEQDAHVVCPVIRINQMHASQG
ncbi:hypothetical protein PVAP13_2KG366100 [Panicum virgatum]|uniref:Uncharacterized protein n=1 Tax=Panicum virgatum TaxID=38727 RepID=A0A8T0WF68_PANVG|nr:hypothetical protein PVAP13_2KG366100 [Panicum virgatum]